ncbi:BPSS1780 family membrane protein [Sterolibacterium denitrificans]|nr:BPSS1780 family membrane protein [Sterolibacterium denitrificans]
MQVRTLPALRGAFWLAAGFLLYRRNAPLLSMLTFANLILALLCSQLQPFGPLLLILASPLFITLIANACVAIERHGQRQLAPQMLTRNLRERGGQLLRLGLLQAFCMMLVVVLADRLLPGIDPAMLATVREAAEATETADRAGRAAIALDAGELGKLFLHLGVIGLIVLPTFWFAPLLTAWHGATPLKSAFFSLVAVWRNWRAFLVYAVSAALLAVLLPALLMSLFSLVSATLGSLVSSVLQLLVLLVGAPILATGTYCSYRDIFATADTAPAAPADNGSGGTRISTDA